MPVTASLATAAAGQIKEGAIGAAETVVGLINEGNAKREAARLAGSRPQDTASPLAAQDLSLAESDLSKGMSSQARAAYDALQNKQF